MRRSLAFTALMVGSSMFAANAFSADTTPGHVVNKQGKTEASKTDTKVGTSVIVSKKGKSKEAVKAANGSTVQRTYENIDTPEDEKRRAAAAHQAATAEERQILGRVRGLQALIEKEEQALAQRLAYAGKLREQGLTKNDQKVLDQAEDLERRALTHYQQKVEQFQRMQVSPGTTKGTTKLKTPTRTQKPQTRNRSTSRSRSRR